MRVAFITPQVVVEKIKKLVAEEFDYIDLTIFVYQNYKEAPNLICGIQKNYDVLLFAGAAPYRFAKEYVKQTIIWEYIPITSSALYHSLLFGVLNRYDIKNISYEYTSDLLWEVYKELNVDDLVQVYAMKQGLNIENDHFLNQEDDKNALRFHIENYKKKQVSLCLTTRYYVEQELTKRQIPNILIYPTNDSLRQTLLQARIKFLAELDRNNQVVVLVIKIFKQGEYSIDSRDEYQFILEKTKVTELVYFFAQKIKAAVFENAMGSYTLFTTKSIIEAETNYFQSFELMQEVEQKTYKSIVIGVGYGKTAFEAKYNGYLALEKAQEVGKNTAFVVYGDGGMLGPLKPEGQRIRRNEILDEKLIRIAEQSQTSMHAIAKLNRIMNQSKKDCFTAKELAEYYSISIRSMNRMLQKLEDAGYAFVIGKTMQEERGRPSRIVKLKF